MRCNKSTEISLQGAAQIVIEVRLESDADDMAEARAGRGVGYGHGRILADTGQTQGRRAEKAESPRRNGGFRYRCLNDVSEKGVEPSLPVKGTSTSS